MSPKTLILDDARRETPTGCGSGKGLGRLQIALATLALVGWFAAPVSAQQEEWGPRSNGMAPPDQTQAETRTEDGVSTPTEETAARDEATTGARTAPGTAPEATEADVVVRGVVTEVDKEDVPEAVDEAIRELEQTGEAEAVEVPGDPGTPAANQEAGAEDTVPGTPGTEDEEAGPVETTDELPGLDEPVERSRLDFSPDVEELTGELVEELAPTDVDVEEMVEEAPVVEAMEGEAEPIGEPAAGDMDEDWEAPGGGDDIGLEALPADEPVRPDEEIDEVIIEEDPDVTPEISEFRPAPEALEMSVIDRLKRIPTLNRFTKIVEKSGLAEELNEAEMLTIFAPVDDAFASERTTRNEEAAAAFVRDHVVLGRSISSADLLRNGSVMVGSDATYSVRSYTPMQAIEPVGDPGQMPPEVDVQAQADVAPELGLGPDDDELGTNVDSRANRMEVSPEERTRVKSETPHSHGPTTHAEVYQDPKEHPAVDPQHGVNEDMPQVLRVGGVAILEADVSAGSGLVHIMSGKLGAAGRTGQSSAGNRGRQVIGTDEAGGPARPDAISRGRGGGR